MITITVSTISTSNETKSTALRSTTEASRNTFFSESERSAYFRPSKLICTSCRELARGTGKEQSRFLACIIVLPVWMPDAMTILADIRSPHVLVPVCDLRCEARDVWDETSKKQRNVSSAQLRSNSKRLPWCEITLSWNPALRNQIRIMVKLMFAQKTSWSRFAHQVE